MIIFICKNSSTFIPITIGIQLSIINYQLEIIGFSIDGCIKAQQAGATRIELCDNPGEGGTTPSYGFIKKAREVLHIDLFVMIRPRGGDFLYSDEEFAMMKEDIEVCKQLGCDGVVFGILKEDGAVDRERNKELVQLAYPMETTFHRAFDRVKEPIQAIEDVISCGFTRILTSGFQPSAKEGLFIIKDLIMLANNRISIMPGSGIRASNLEFIALKTGAKEFHSSARLTVDGGMLYQNPALPDNAGIVSVDEAEINKLVNILSVLE